MITENEHIKALMETLKDRTESDLARKNPQYALACVMFARVLSELPDLLAYEGEEELLPGEDVPPEDTLNNLLDSVEKPDRMN